MTSLKISTSKAMINSGRLRHALWKRRGHPAKNCPMAEGIHGSGFLVPLNLMWLALGVRVQRLSRHVE